MKIIAKDKPSTDTIVEFYTEEDAKKIKDFFGKKGEVHINYEKKHRKILLGLGKKQKLELEALRRACDGAIKFAKSLKIETFDVILPNYFSVDVGSEAVTAGLTLANYDFDKYKTEDKKKFEIKKINLLCNKQNLIKETQKICQNVKFTRDWINENASAKYPNRLAKLAQDICKKYKIKCTVFSESQLKKMGMNLLLAVGDASDHGSRLVVMEYNGGGKGKIALVGKGVTFDSGGLNLKPTGYMETMRQDMSGAMVVLAVMKTLAELNIKTNVVAVMPLAENMIGPTFYKPGDVLKSYNGKTVEIWNTDAEGRLILADALSYVVKKYKPDQVIDFATLTGSIIVALGTNVAGLFSNNDDLAQNLITAGKNVDELLWRMPMFDSYKELLKSEVADINHCPKKRDAGAITAALFLESFVENTPFAHIDIAGTAWSEEAKGYIKKNATGYGVRLMIDFLKNKK